MIRDDNKGIKTITYNHLNLPTKITFVNGNFITYLYNAVGQKVNKTVQQSADFIIDKTDYLSGFQYFNEILRFFPHAEGYVNATKNKFDYDFDYVFNYTDHLGNIRLSYSKDINTNALKVIEENHYYPFGLKHTGYNSDVMLYVLEVAPLFKGQPELFTRKLKPKQSVDLPANNYKYNGKEYQDELGLNMYDYGARNYDAALGRWMNIDPLAETSRSWSTYTYCYNNPLRFTDPDGMRAFDSQNPNDNDDDYQTDKKGNVKLIKETDEKTDTLYNEDKSKSVEVKKGLIEQLTKPRKKDENGTAYTSIGEQSEEHEKDYFKLFKFLSDNAFKVEFSLYFFKNKGKDFIELSTYHDSQMAPGANVDRNNIYKTYHSHSDTENNTIKERASIGQGSDGWIMPGLRSDFYNTVVNKYPHPNYVYFPLSGRLYNVTQTNVDFIKIVKTSSNFK